jgi:taurine dioxygenase
MTIIARPLTAAIGADVTGVDLASVSDLELDDLSKAFLDHKVLFFRDQHISIDEHVDFGRRWGDLEVHPFAHDMEDHPEIVTVKCSPEQPYAAEMWHSDVTWREEPSMASILRARVLPEVGGDTCWANTEMAYDRLSDDWKERIEGKVCVHDYARVFGHGLSEEKAAKMREEYPPARHPVVRTHPESGARSIYTNRSFGSHIEDVPKDESEAILGHLERAVSSPTVQCRFRWEVDSFAMWDNRCTQHFATSDFFPGTRRMERVTIVGDRPF